MTTSGLTFDIHEVVIEFHFLQCLSASCALMYDHLIMFISFIIISIVVVAVIIKYYYNYNYYYSIVNTTTNKPI